jgi:hypothetical protein
VLTFGLAIDYAGAASGPHIVRNSPAIRGKSIEIASRQNAATEMIAAGALDIQ